MPEGRAVSPALAGALAQRWASFGSGGSQPPLWGGPGWGWAAGWGAGARGSRSPARAIAGWALRRRSGGRSPGLGGGAGDLENNEA